MQTLSTTWVHGYPFTLPVPLAFSGDQFRLWAGIYIVAREQTGATVTLDVGESEDIGFRIANHDRQGCWNLHRFSQPVVVYAHVESDPVRRREIEADLRVRLTPPCGQR